MNTEFLHNLVNLFFNAMFLLIFARVLMSWIPSMANNSIGKFVHDVTEPFLGPLRKVIPPISMIDISPIVAFILLSVLKNFVEGLI